MPGWIPLRLRPLLGADLDEVTVESIQNLVGMREDRDLEFKRERYGTSDGQKKEAAYDVAALANASGGVIIIGMQEDGSDVAAGLSPQGDAGDFGAWLHQVVAARVSPAVQINCRSLSNPEGFVYVVCVEPSTRKPHGVHVGDEALRYPIRSGTTKRYLVESEVADMYSRRFFTQASVDDMVAGLHSTARSLTTAAGKRGSVAFLTLSCVPSSPGSLDLEDGVQDRWLESANMSIRRFPMSLRLSGVDMERMFLRASVGFRSIELADWLDEQRNFYSLFARLSLNGSGTVIFGYPESTQVDGVDTTWSALVDSDRNAEHNNCRCRCAEPFAPRYCTHACDRSLLGIRAGSAKTGHDPESTRSAGIPREAASGPQGVGYQRGCRSRLDDFPAGVGRGKSLSCQEGAAGQRCVTAQQPPGHPGRLLSEASHETRTKSATRSVPR